VPGERIDYSEPTHVLSATYYGSLSNPGVTHLVPALPPLPDSYRSIATGIDLKIALAGLLLPTPGAAEQISLRPHYLAPKLSIPIIDRLLSSAHN
jgi:hypothetical protein